MILRNFFGMHILVWDRLTACLMQRIMQPKSAIFLQKGIAMLNLDTDTHFITPKTLLSMISNAQGFSRGLPYDLHSLFETQRTNLQAFAEAHQIILAGWQEAAQQQSSIFSTLWQNQTALMNLIIDEGTPEEKIVRHAEVSKKHYQHIVHEARKMQDNMTEALRNAADTLHHRAMSTLSEGQRQASKAHTALIPANAGDITHRKIAA